MILLLSGLVIGLCVGYPWGAVDKFGSFQEIDRRAQERRDNEIRCPRCNYRKG